MNEIITSSLDQEMPSEIWLLEDYDKKVAAAVEQRDVTILYDAIRDLREKAKAVGLTLAKMLYTASQCWEVFGIDEDFTRAFYEPVGLHQHTVERYVKVWSMFETRQIPESLEREFKDKNIKSLIPIAHAIDQGYEIGEGDWKRLAYAPDYASTARIVRDDIKNQEPRKNALQLFLKRDGSVVCYKGPFVETVAWLDVNNSSPVVQQAIERIKKNSGMLEE
jgi:hypothetical protein